MLPEHTVQDCSLVEEMNRGSMFAAQSGSRLLSLYRFSSSIFSCKKETGMEHPRVLCGSVLTWNPRKATLSFRIFERWSIACEKVMFVSGRNDSDVCQILPFSPEMRGQGSCGSSLSCPSFQASTHRDPSGSSGRTEESRTSCFGKRGSPCCFLCRYFGGKQRFPPLNLSGHKDISGTVQVGFYCTQFKKKKCVCMYVHTHIYIYMDVYTYLYICVYIHM